jgi:hypothetical protein
MIAVLKCVPIPTASIPIRPPTEGEDLAVRPQRDAHVIDDLTGPLQSSQILPDQGAPIGLFPEAAPVRPVDGVPHIDVLQIEEAAGDNGCRHLVASFAHLNPTIGQVPPFLAFRYVAAMFAPGVTHDPPRMIQSDDRGSAASPSQA